MFGVGLIVFAAGVVGLIKPSWLRLPNRGVAALVLVAGFVLAGTGASREADRIADRVTAPPPTVETRQSSSTQDQDDPAPETQVADTEPEPEQPLWTNEETDYRLWVIRHTTTFSDLFDNLGALLREPRMWEQEWVIQVGARIAQMRLLVDEAREKQAPEAFAKSHAHYLDAMDEYGYVAEHLPRAIDNLDADLMDELTVRMERGAANVALATEETQKVISERER